MRAGSTGPAGGRPGGAGPDVADARLLSLVLRHRPEVADVRLDAAGWVDVDELLAGLARTGRPMSRARLEHRAGTW